MSPLLLDYPANVSSALEFWNARKAQDDLRKDG
jgi:hypothetical protein